MPVVNCAVVKETACICAVCTAKHLNDCMLTPVQYIDVHVHVHVCNSSSASSGFDSYQVQVNTTC